MRLIGASIHPIPANARRQLRLGNGSGFLGWS